MGKEGYPPLIWHWNLVPWHRNHRPAQQAERYATRRESALKTRECKV